MEEDVALLHSSCKEILVYMSGRNVLGDNNNKKEEEEEEEEKLSKQHWRIVLWRISQ